MNFTDALNGFCTIVGILNVMIALVAFLGDKYDQATFSLVLGFMLLWLSRL